MAEAGKARGAAVGSKTQARRVALQQEGQKRARPWVEVQEHQPASLQGLVNRLPDEDKVREAMGLGPAGGVELRSAQEDLQEHERQREHQFDLPPDLVAMKPHMHPESWNRVLEQRALNLLQEEAADRANPSWREPNGQDFQRGYQAAQWAVEQVKAQGAVAGGAEQALKERASLPGLTGWAAPNVPERGVWAELENLRHQVLKAHQIAETLAERLGGVLVPAEELVATRVAGPTPPSRLSEEVHLVAVSVVQVQDLLDRLLTRLDL